MKKLLIVIVAFVFASCNQTKIAYIDIEVLMKDYEATKTLEIQIKEKQEKMTKELDSIAMPFKLKVQQYYQKAQNMSAQKRAQIEQALQQEQQIIQAQQQQASQVLQQENQENYKSITKKVDSLVESYAKSNGYQLIFGTSGKGTVMYGDEALNVTKDVLKVLNSEFSK
ncbi:hypothetical protein Lupro_08615 [Lutibacter profundi]|uniref:Outer membrane chaperone Skp n=1 Tax=Lutibacter profundi TaxID=1622118 RepID=A0A0X8G782_9FLAO|nr:OmpH family outer membrane protein [Lutibacter profundi]AMC11313.1 hypothetical protein Lupro_08615 [Lutibacter profundi]